jgi:hypothetical protein
MYKINKRGLCLWCSTPLSAIYVSYIVAVSFIGGGNQSIPTLTFDLENQ